MKPPPFAYHAPDSVEEVLATLADAGDGAKLLAGGQSLVPLLNLRLAAPSAIVDLARVASLDAVEVGPSDVRVQAMVTHEHLRRHAAAAAAVPLLPRALALVAHPAIRNRGTTVGSIVHADPAGELPAVLVLLGGTVELRSAARGAREVAAGDFLQGPLDAAIEPDELAVAVRFPRPPARTGLQVLELARRHGDYALAGVAVRVTVDEDRRVTDAATVAFGVGGTPCHVGLAEVLGGRPADALVTADAVTLVRERIRPGDDVHASASYRTHLVGVLLHRALVAAGREAAEVDGVGAEEAA